jgi:hypothetical protein
MFKGDPGQEGGTSQKIRFCEDTLLMKVQISSAIVEKSMEVP